MPPPNTPEEYFESQYQNRHPSGVPSAQYQLNRDRILYNQRAASIVTPGGWSEGTAMDPQEQPGNNPQAQQTNNPRRPLLRIRLGGRTPDPNRYGAGVRDIPTVVPQPPGTSQLQLAVPARGFDRLVGPSNSRWQNLINADIQALSAAIGETRQGKIPRLDWAALEYVGPYDNNLDCPICHFPFVKPVVLRCNHIFCRHCLEETLMHSRSCPIDRGDLEIVEGSEGLVKARDPPHIILNQLDNLRVKCPNKRCEHICARSLVKHHYLKECLFTKIPCPDESCDKLVTRQESEEGTCLHHEVDCVHCGKPIDLASMEDHYDTDCEQKEIACEHCGDQVPRHRHGAHTANCPERKIGCKFKVAGCAYEVAQKDFGDHESICLYGMILRIDQSRRSEIESLTSKLRDTRERLHKLEVKQKAPATTMQSFLSPSHRSGRAPEGTGTPNSGGPSGNTETPPPETPPQSTPATPEDRIAHALATLDIFDVKVNNVERYMGEVDARQTQLVMNEITPIKEQIVELRNTVGQISMYVRWLMESFRQTTKRSGAAASVSTAGDDDSSSDHIGNHAPGSNGAQGVGAIGAASSQTEAGPGANRPALPTQQRRMSSRQDPPRL